MSANTKRPECLGSKEKHDPVAATTIIWSGSLVCLDASGNAVQGSATTGLIARGVNKGPKVDNSAGLAGDKFVDSEAGCFGFANKSGDEVTAAMIGDVCYISTEVEVCATSTGKSVAGVVEKIEGGLVYVLVGTWPVQVGLLAANNLSDVTAATARANIGANKGAYTFEKVSSKGSDAEVARIVADRAGTITGFKTVLNAALATGDATAQLKINGTNVGSTTTGLITQTQSGSAAGDVDTCTPLTTNLTFVAGDVISVTAGGASTATATFNLSVAFTY